ncbi:MAG: hypothetical protein QOF68_1869 [Gaiellales bacterium]|nr:hypothetical protein [Gaiellales bacterium]
MSVASKSDDPFRRIRKRAWPSSQSCSQLAIANSQSRETVPPQLEELCEELSGISEGITSMFDELREISRVIHPAILSEGGLGPALKALTRRSAVPGELAMRAEGRRPESVQVAVYYVVSEALTNAAKYAQASVVSVELDTGDGRLRLTIRDDGIGGADAAQGSGLVGVSDRVEALRGTFHVTSPAGTGTTLIEVPLEDPGAASPEP